MTGGMVSTAKSGIQIIGATIFVLLLLTLVAVWLGVIRIPLMNLQREVNQNSQQYVETKRSLLLALLSDYEQAEGEEGRQAALANRICEEASLIQSSEWPSSVAAFASRHC